MKILVVGGGGREHSLAWKLSQSPNVGRVFAAPGNDGIAMDSAAESVPISADDCLRLAEFASEKKIRLAVVGPENPLADGIADVFAEQKIPLFGPTKAAAKLESSKSFAKEFMRQNGIPTPQSCSFDSADSARDYLRKLSPPFVVKADGLAAGKGVVISQNLKDAEEFAVKMIRDFKRIVVEEFIGGREMSFIAMCDGDFAIPLATSQDYKRLQNGDAGPNTGGMGAISPSPLANAKMESAAMEKIILPTLRGMKKAGTPYRGFLYAGLIFRGDDFLVLEFNCRLGDPESQVILPRFNSDLAAILELAAVHSAEFKRVKLEWDSRPTAGIVLAAAGYPQNPKRGDEIKIENAEPQSQIFFAGVKRQNGKLITDGGRILCATAFGESAAAARNRAYSAAKKIRFDGMQFRKDIGA